MSLLLLLLIASPLPMYILFICHFIYSIVDTYCRFAAVLRVYGLVWGTVLACVSIAIDSFSLLLCTKPDFVDDDDDITPSDDNHCW